MPISPLRIKHALDCLRDAETWLDNSYPNHPATGLVRGAVCALDKELDRAEKQDYPDAAD